MSTLRLEFFKCRRRKIFLVGLALIAAQLLWVYTSLVRMDPEDLRQGWMWLLYDLAMVDSFMLPLATAVIASRNCEIEHKGSTLKILETLTTPGKIYNAKLLWGAIVLAILMIIRSALFLGVGYYEAFPGTMPYRTFAVFTFVSWIVSLMLYTLQQGTELTLRESGGAAGDRHCRQFSRADGIVFPKRCAAAPALELLRTL